MMYRTDTTPHVDRQVFNRTARGTRKINVAPRISRGGILL